VEIRCVCPAKTDGSPRHDHDEITLKERLDFRSSVAIRNALALASAENDWELDFADILAILTERFIRYGIEAWTIVDAKNQPVPVSQKAITEYILSDIDLGTQVGDEVDERYRTAALTPLMQGGQTSLRGSSTSGSTSAARSKRTTAKSSTRSSTRPTPSSPSSISTIPTAATETTSNALDGGSSLSPKSITAA
jgi:hypothetical protein